MSQIQIFGRAKCKVTRKAERFFKERGIPYQFVDLEKKGLSKGELDRVAAVCGGVDALIDRDGKDAAMILYLTPASRYEKLLDEPRYLKTPIVRCGARAAVGDGEAAWKEFAALQKEMKG